MSLLCKICNNERSEKYLLFVTFGVKTFRYKQSSEPEVNSSWILGDIWRHPELSLLALKTPVQFAIGFGGYRTKMLQNILYFVAVVSLLLLTLNRRLSTGGSA